MNRPFSRRQSSQLNAFHAALFDKRNRVLKIVVRVLRSVGRENRAGLHRFAVNRFDHAEFVRADFDERHFLNDALNRV